MEDIPQNTGGRHHHDCEFCYVGCKGGIKNGTMNTWLRDAHQHNAKFLDKTKVIRVVTRDGKAIGVECIVHYDRKVYIKANEVCICRLFTVSWCSFEKWVEKNIGQTLRFHPVMVVLGFFDRPIRPHQGSYMTALSGVAEDLENDGYGAKLETPVFHL